MTATNTHAITWPDEVHPYSELFGDHFYSTEDGRSETAHVFICGNRLEERWTNKSHFKIGELGFGTGLNFLETWRRWRLARTTGQTLSFFSVEAFPMNEEEMRTALETWPELAALAGQLVKNWEECRKKPVFLDDQTSLNVFEKNVGEALDKFPHDIDCWYLDGFSPAKNADMWSQSVMSKLAARTVPGGTFATYTSAGWVRRNLENAGFIVKKKPGYGRKRHMTAGHLETSP